MATLSAMFKLNDQYSKTLKTLESNNARFTNSLLGASNKVDNLNNKLANSNGSNSFISNIKRAAIALGGFMAVKKSIDIADTYINTRSRLDNMNDGLQTTAELQDKVFIAAERSRGSYMEMQKAVAKLGQMAGDSFGSSQEIVDFSELLQKSFKVGGASISEQASGMLQLSQAMSSGILQGDEFRSISENAPMITKAIADYMGVTKGELKELSSDGQITSDIIRAAMFSAADDINKKFETMPKTWGDITNHLKNQALKSLEPVIEKFSELINSPIFAAFITFIVGGLNIIAGALIGLMDIIMSVGNLIQEWWFIIEPMLLAAAIVLIPLIIAQLYQMAVAAWAAVVPWLIAHIPILIVIAVIGLLIYVLMQFGVTTEQIVGGVVGSFMMLFAIIYNGFAWCYNILATFAEFLANIFIDPIYAVKKLFYELAKYINEIFLAVAQELQNMLGAIGLTADLTSMFVSNIKYLDGKIDGLKSAKDVVKIDRMEYKDHWDAFDKGNKWGAGAVGKLKGMNLSTPTVPTGPGSMGDLSKYMDGGALPVKNGKGGSGAKLNVSIDKEDIKYLKDIADRDYLLKYSQSTLAPNIQVTFGDVKETADVNQIQKVLTKMLEEQIAVVAEGAM
ncbi:TPA: tape measure protein [Escherichia coli]|nr:tape measure protein [Escherichia coli]HAY3976958.1 tape measure protein [Escherichia coli]HBB9210929.1 tape measure protein [Escherichia coli]